jgi:hypothetical protein
MLKAANRKGEHRMSGFVKTSSTVLIHSLQYASADESYCAARCVLIFGSFGHHWRSALYTLAGRFAE